MVGRGSRVLRKVPENGGSEGKGRGSATRLTVAVAVVAVVAVASGVALVWSSKASESARSAAADVRARVGQHRNGAAAVPLRVLTVSPASGSARVSGDVNVQVVFSASLAHGAPMPALTPSVAGRWQITGNMLLFTPAAPFIPATRFSVRIPAGQAGVRSADGGALAKPVTARFRTAAYSRLRLAELLSQLGYLPLSWLPNAGGRLSGGSFGDSVRAQEELAYSPPTGSFTWHRGYPATLRQQWHPDRANPLIRGAVMAFQAQHRMAIDGVTKPRFWHALFAAAATGQRNADGYTYAIASKGSPETLTIWHDGRRVLRSLANTGISVAPTASGTFPVYLRYRYQIMQGTNPDGSHYADPVTFVAYFDGGDAVHYFPRGSYGWPQSLGCVELPYSNAERAWPYLTYGSLVTVTG